MELALPDPDEPNERDEELGRTNPEEVVTDFGGVRLRSTFDVVEDSSGNLIFEIEGLQFEIKERESENEGP